jgi:hypothetical protein
MNASWEVNPAQTSSDGDDRQVTQFDYFCETNFYIPITQKTFDNAFRIIYSDAAPGGVWAWDHISARVLAGGDAPDSDVRYERNPYVAKSPSAIDLTTTSGVASFILRSGRGRVAPLAAPIVVSQHVFERALAFQVARDEYYGVQFRKVGLHHVVDQMIAYSITIAGFDVGHERERPGDMGVRSDETEHYIVYTLRWRTSCVAEFTRDESELAARAASDVMFGLAREISPVMDSTPHVALAMNTHVTTFRVIKSYAPMSTEARAPIVTDGEWRICANISDMDRFNGLYEVIAKWYHNMCLFARRNFINDISTTHEYETNGVLDPVLSAVDPQSVGWQKYARMRPPPYLQGGERSDAWHNVLESYVSVGGHLGIDRALTRRLRALHKLPPFARYRMLYAEVISHMTTPFDSHMCNQEIHIRKSWWAYKRNHRTRLTSSVRARLYERYGVVILAKHEYAKACPGDIFAHVRRKTNSYVTNIVANFFMGLDVHNLRAFCGITL